MTKLLILAAMFAGLANTAAAMEEGTAAKCREFAKVLPQLEETYNRVKPFIEARWARYSVLSPSDQDDLLTLKIQLIKLEYNILAAKDGLESCSQLERLEKLE